MELYDPIFINDYVPVKRYQRVHWIDNIIAFLITFAHGSSIGTVCFAWKVPEVIDQRLVSQTTPNLTLISQSAITAMGEEFFDK